MSERDEPVTEEQIQARSYQIWLRERCPPGRQLEHWFRAKAELRSERLQGLRRGDMPNGHRAGIYFWDHIG